MREPKLRPADERTLQISTEKFQLNSNGNMECQVDSEFNIEKTSKLKISHLTSAPGPLFKTVLMRTQVVMIAIRKLGRKSFYHH